MSYFICPKCKSPLNRNEKSYYCKNKHSFDISKEGYVNLLQFQSKNKRHGDDKLMVDARKNFLNKGYYNKLAENISNAAYKYAKDKLHILDIGCGECYYTKIIYDLISKDYKNIALSGIDISKHAVMQGAKRLQNISLAASSANNIPICDNSCDIVINIFAPLFIDEIKRILKNDGKLIRIIPLQNHLYSLKEKIYDKVLLNKVNDINLSGFNLIEKTDVSYNISINNNTDILNLFKMTPYYYKTSSADQEKVKNLDLLTCEIQCAILVYEKIKNSNNEL